MVTAMGVGVVLREPKLQDWPATATLLIETIQLAFLAAYVTSSLSFSTAHSFGSATHSWCPNTGATIANAWQY